MKRDGFKYGCATRSPKGVPYLAATARLRPSGFGAAAFTRFASEGWWARQDSNLQPDRYERPALTIELQAPPRNGRGKGGRQRCRHRLQA